MALCFKPLDNGAQPYGDYQPSSSLKLSKKKKKKRKPVIMTLAIESPLEQRLEGII